MSPTPARFDRLVTQLQWRLLEGGGQAYYELGVADSGMLVGLPRQQLEESLETLVLMAGEIDASVTVVKEIEVPPEVSSLAESQMEKWDASKRSARRKDLLRMMRQDGSPTTPTAELETELSNTDVTDTEETSSDFPVTLPPSPGGGSIIAHPKQSPNLLPFDPALAMFTMDVGEDVADYAGNEALDGDVPVDYMAGFCVSLAISSVCKPCPKKKRTIQITGPPLSHFECAKMLKNGYPPSHSVDPVCHTKDPMAQNSDEIHLQPDRAKVQFRKAIRDKRRKWKPGSLPIHIPTHHFTGSQTSPISHHDISPCSTDELDISALESLQIAVVDPPTSDASETTTAIFKEPRLIIEVLVIWERELHLDEAFIDLENFSLQ